MADTTQPAGALPEPEVLARNAYNWVIATGYTADQMRAMMAERDEARSQRDAIHLCYEHLQRCHDDPPADLQERVLKAAGLWDIAMERDALRRELEELRAIPPDAREGREPLTPEQADALYDEWSREVYRCRHDFNAGLKAAEKHHGIGPAGTSADGETQP